MQRPTALAAVAIGLSVLSAGVLAPAPTLAQALEAAIARQRAEPPSADEPQPVIEAPGAAGLDADVPRADPLQAETPPEAAGQIAGAATDDLPPVEAPSEAVARMARWIVASGDSGGLPFVIVDKVAADVFVYDADGSVLGASPVLVGLAQGDGSAEGVGDRALSAVTPEERTTPAGRFVAGFGPALGHRRVLWVDYATAISLHPVVTNNPKEHRLERLHSPAPEDRRITYGCINVPAAFYQDVVLTAFAGGNAIVYILPDTRPLEEVFPGVGISAHAGAAPAGDQIPPPPPNGDDAPIVTSNGTDDAHGGAGDPGSPPPAEAGEAPIVTGASLDARHEAAPATEPEIGVGSAP